MSSNAHHIPEGFASVTPYLTVQGADRLIDFLKEVFGAEEVTRMERPEGGIAHAAVRLGDSMIELSEFTGEWGPTPCALHVYVEDPDAVYRRALAAGAVSLYEPADHEYGERSGGVRDHAGNNWYIAKHLGNPVSDTSGAQAPEGNR